MYSPLVSSRDTFAGVAAVAQHDESIRHLRHFLDEVRDVHDRQPLLLEPADQLEQFLHVAVREAARRLVEHEHAAAERQRARDLDQLLRRGRQPTDRRVEREYPNGRAVRAPRARSGGPRRGRRFRMRQARRGAPARRRERCCPSRSGGARAIAPDRSSRRLPGALREDREADTACRSASSSRHRESIAPASMDISVLLPAPFCPTSAHTSPPRTARSTPSSATVPPNALRTPRISNCAPPTASTIGTGRAAAAP